MSNISQAEIERPSVYSVAGIVLNILSAIKNNSIDAVNEIDVTTNEVEFNSDKFLEDTAVEQTLCAIWDLSSLEEYANILVNECQIHRIMLKLITSTARNRTKELSLGVLANLACFPDKAMILIGDMDLLNIIQVLIKDDENEDDVRVLFEASSFVRNILTNSPHYNSDHESTLSEFLFNDNLVSRFNYFLKNTLNDDLFFASLEILNCILFIGIPEQHFEFMSLEIIECFNNICERISTFKDISRKLFITIINLMNILLETGLIPPDVFERNHGTLYQLQHRTKDEYSDEDGDDDEILNLIETFKNKIELSKKR
ncbi:1630_t:CDS:2 [Funneliformis mosseae]|uniref:1630_t:CDS:1 n=1 Tax=Funneliformis mosseae TaxID=27381 RepID=A0A9N9FRN0_FUNMO|nr:1630_t:CDS:2 [Funneliformis mosseae]